LNGRCLPYIYGDVNVDASHGVLSAKIPVNGGRNGRMTVKALCRRDMDVWAFVAVRDYSRPLSRSLAAALVKWRRGSCKNIASKKSCDENSCNLHR